MSAGSLGINLEIIVQKYLIEQSKLYMFVHLKLPQKHVLVDDNVMKK